MAAKKKGDSTFRIAETQRPEVRAPQKGGKKAAEEPSAPSVGFPGIETRLESGTIDDLADELGTSYEKLEELATGNDLKKRAAARKAMAAYERVADLFEYLYETKEALQFPGK